MVLEVFVHGVNCTSYFPGFDLHNEISVESRSGSIIALCPVSSPLSPLTATKQITAFSGQVLDVTNYENLGYVLVFPSEFHTPQHSHFRVR